MKKLKKIAQIVGLAVLIVLIVWVFNHLKKQAERPAASPGNDHVIKEEIYTPPIIKLPFIKDKQPVKTGRLPIPKKEIEKTIEIETVSETGEKQETVLIIDKKGQIHKAADTPESTKITVTKWKPKFFDIDFGFGYSFAYSFDNHFYHCLSVDFLRLGDRFYFGPEIGLGMKGLESFDRILIGLSGKCRLIEIGGYGKDSSIKISALAGWDFMGKRIYAGLNLTW